MLQIKASPDFAESPLSHTALRPAFEDAMPASCPLATADARVFVGLFDLHDWQPWLDDACALLDAAECRRIRARRIAADRDRLALAYALHRLLLGKALGCDAVDVPIGRDPAGRPRLSGDLLFTSLSHADHVLAVAITRTGPVGVDIEPTSRVSVMAEISGQVCHLVETAAVIGLAEPARSEALLALWVRKEAFLKAAGIGLQREMHTFLAPDNALLALPAGNMSRVRMLDAGPHCVAAVACAPDASIECRWLRPGTSC